MTGEGVRTRKKSGGNTRVGPSAIRGTIGNEICADKQVSNLEANSSSANSGGDDCVSKLVAINKKPKMLGKKPVFAAEKRKATVGNAKSKKWHRFRSEGRVGRKQQGLEPGRTIGVCIPQGKRTCMARDYHA